MWTINYASWGGALSLPNYLKREQYLATGPLGANGGLTHWILVDSTLPPNKRATLASCESLRKRALVAYPNGPVREVITHGIGSVYCNPSYRGKGYAGRMLRELGPTLRTWQTGEKVECEFSILYSDIGKTFYAGLGWHPFPSSHLSSASSSSSKNGGNHKAKALGVTDLKELCETDEKYIRNCMERVNDGKIHVATIPDHETMKWHHRREQFLCSHIFPNRPAPSVKGAISGESQGSRIWAIWTRSFSGPLVPESDNALHILRLVIEDEKVSDDNVEGMKGILEIAQKEAKEWKLEHVELWNPTDVARALVQRAGLEYSQVDREAESIPSLMWYGEGSGKVDEIEWVGNEKFGWC